MEANAVKTATIQVEGMTCQNCVRHVKDALTKVNGVQDAQVDLGTHAARILYDATQAGPPALMGAINQAGYKASGFRSVP